MNHNQCTKCKWIYPEGVVNPAFMNGFYVNLCPLCYEEILGIRLRAPRAVGLKDYAIQYRKNNPDKKPKES